MLKKITDSIQRKKLLEFLPKNDINLNVSNVERLLVSKNIKINKNIIEQACAALNAGLHIIFTGPPGTGKTTLAEAIAKEAFNNGFSKGDGLFTTATADWTTFDTIGGYLPSPSSLGGMGYSLKFFEGQFLESISKNEWLIIDELNRADIDKAIGPLFTVLSKKSVHLPYFINEKRIKIEFNNISSTEESIFTVLPTWRVIATMNSYDKMSLYRISSAFLRRFAIIYVGLPENYKTYILNKVKHLETDVQKSFINVIIKLCKVREIGPSIVEDMIKYIGKRVDQKKGFCESINLFLMPQIEGEDFEKLDDCFTIMSDEIDFITVDVSSSSNVQRLIYIIKDKDMNADSINQDKDVLETTSLDDDETELSSNEEVVVSELTDASKATSEEDNANSTGEGSDV